MKGLPIANFQLTDMTTREVNKLAIGNRQSEIRR